MTDIPQNATKSKKQADPARIAEVRATYGMLYETTKTVNGKYVRVYNVIAPSCHHHSYRVSVRQVQSKWVGFECTCGSYLRECKHQAAVCEELNSDPPADCPKCAYGHMIPVQYPFAILLMCTDCGHQRRSDDDNTFTEFSEAA